ncbi:MAG: FCD domain-containing protein [Actinophytocola sp.]|nr:FCD domain-containing protein [Actinophytocola sp.]
MLLLVATCRLGDWLRAGRDHQAAGHPHRRRRAVESDQLVFRLAGARDLQQPRSPEQVVGAAHRGVHCHPRQHRALAEQHRNPVQRHLPRHEPRPGQHLTSEQVRPAPLRHEILSAGMQTTLTIPGRLEKSRQDHERIFAAIMAGDGTAARRAARAHIAGARTAALRRSQQEEALDGT